MFSPSLNRYTKSNHVVLEQAHFYFEISKPKQIEAGIAYSIFFKRKKQSEQATCTSLLSGSHPVNLTKGKGNKNDNGKKKKEARKTVTITRSPRYIGYFSFE